jgi:formate-dependent nitrite reductase membrane component NrfD
VILAEEAQHFVRDPDWTWYILGYFFFGGLSGGSYAIASMLRLGGRRDEPAARVGYYISFVALLPCPVLLTLDLGQPLRFWHMLVNTTPGDEGVILHLWSPMSVGAWALVIFGGFATISFLEVWLRDRRQRGGDTDRPVESAGILSKLFSIVGAVLGLFVAGYTGVLLSVSNQPVWSDTWALGGLFLASGLSGSAALMAWLVRYRRDATDSGSALARGERLFQLLELILIVTFVITLIPTGALDQAFGFPWLLLWVVVAIGLLAGLGSSAIRRRSSGDGVVAGPDGTVAVRAVHTVSLIPATLVLLGVLALRAAIIFSAQ